MPANNLFDAIPTTLESEAFEDIVNARNVRIERILSKGHASPELGWYDQDENEWVVVLKGSGRLVFDDGRSVTLNVGDYVDIPAHRRHRVEWTDPDEVTLWLAVFYRQA